MIDKRNWAVLADQFARAITSDRRNALATRLGVTVEALDAIGVGWATVDDLHAMKAGGDGWDETHPEGAYVFPEQDGGGRVVGLSLRAEDGRKGFPSGAKRGLIVPTTVDQFAGTILCVEGATDVCACLTLGLGAVGRPSNSGGVEHLAERLVGWDVLIVGENDEKEDGTSWPGRKGAMDVAAKLAGEWARPVRWTLPPDGVKDIRALLRAKIADGLLLDDAEACRAAGRELLAALERNAERAEPKRAGSRAELVRIGDVEPEAICWLWPGRIARGKVTLIAGDPGLGKSFLTLDIAARVSRGRAWPDALDVVGEPGGVVLLSAEDDVGDTIRPRLDAAGADVDRIFALQAVRRADADGGDRREMFSLARDLPALEHAIGRVGECHIVVIDPVTAYLGHADGDDNAEVRGVLAPLVDLAARTGVAVLAVTHLRKSTGKAMYRSIGSIGFMAAARAAWAVARDEDDAERRLFLPMKNNIAADTGGLAFRLRVLDGAGTTPALVWEPGAVTMTADEVLAVEPGHDRRTDRPERDEATDWLRGLLADGPVSAADVRAAAKGDGLGWRTIMRAKSDAGVQSHREGFGTGGVWLWSLQGEAAKSATAKDAKAPGERNVGTLCDRGTLRADGPENGVSGGPSNMAAPKDAKVSTPLAREDGDDGSAPLDLGHDIPEADGGIPVEDYEQWTA